MTASRFLSFISYLDSLKAFTGRFLLSHVLDSVSHFQKKKKGCWKLFLYLGFDLFFSVSLRMKNTF